MRVILPPLLPVPDPGTPRVRVLAEVDESGAFLALSQIRPSVMNWAEACTEEEAEARTQEARRRRRQVSGIQAGTTVIVNPGGTNEQFARANIKQAARRPSLPTRSPSTPGLSR